jgi:transcriptional regulator of acetoin/glycerol metabolism
LTGSGKAAGGLLEGSRLQPIVGSPKVRAEEAVWHRSPEEVQQAIHDMSRRRGRPMVRVNCAAIPTALMESERFGRERGAYTGPLSRPIGRFELADGTTLFLDEIGGLSLEAPTKLLGLKATTLESRMAKLGIRRPGR